MISDYERCEIADGLRRLVNAYHDTDVPNSEILDVLGVSSADTPNRSDTCDVEMLADIIDRPTCKCVSMDAAGCPPFYTGGLALNDVVKGCSECGYPFGNSNTIIGNLFNVPNYCPNCGSMVVINND